MLTDQQIDLIRDKCRAAGVCWVGLFGSVARNEERPDSDVDLLVEYRPDARPDLIDLVELEYELSDQIGRKVDLGTDRAFRKEFRPYIEPDLKVIYDSTDVL